MIQQDEFIRGIWQLLESSLAAAGYELIEVELARHSGGPLLRLFIDKKEGVTLDDCTRATHLVSPILDQADLIVEHYVLEVSSPGFDRPLRKPEHFQQYVGETIKLRAHTAVNGRKRFTGELKGIEDGLVGIDCGDQVFSIHIENIEKARLVR